MVLVLCSTELLNFVEACAREQFLKNDFLFASHGCYVVFFVHHSETPAFIYHFVCCVVLCCVYFAHSKMKEKNRRAKNHVHVFAMKIAHVLLMAAKQHFYFASTRFICFQVTRSFLITWVLSLYHVVLRVLNELCWNIAVLYRQSFFLCIGRFRSKGNCSVNQQQ